MHLPKVAGKHQGPAGLAGAQKKKKKKQQEEGVWYMQKPEREDMPAASRAQLPNPEQVMRKETLEGLRP